ncbi:hypothetical protein, partial [Erwinia sp. OAMSP11]
KGYVVHSMTTAPYNNTWSKSGLSPSSVIYKSGTYLISGYYEGRGDGVSRKDMAGWYGFHIESSETTKTGHYVGTNAFGVTKDVEVLNTKGAAIIFGTTMSPGGYVVPVWADINVIGDIPADVNMSDLRIEYLAKIETIGNQDFTGSSSPTLNNPTDSLHITKNYTGELIAARLVNIKNKEIYPVKMEWVFRTRDAFPD